MLNYLGMDKDLQFLKENKRLKREEMGEGKGFQLI